MVGVVLDFMGESVGGVAVVLAWVQEVQGWRHCVGRWAGVEPLRNEAGQRAVVVGVGHFVSR
ncbi:hypothetical protein HanRHA438_Chr03g0129161 [Helianthus annuus]|uniref:Uncharacterized protein n=1 Tax=Helianthus annuus TaxID=4232 RepID=A0A251V7K7_HELAN|nr:hypothetical protein HanXRQr2_Chr03g0117261 [Helianthus annuus]KAJ0601436.1 hypothetical protein HanIR_Chr03g0128321 [Helianthus annuus]KAJ0608544.1 hypothetical protein HanHA89_Chr03g0109751 [Helianthus annuus]KAJ0936297.1 hypothetical protein HanRHA438_Chr03g0129161 [Helianthus annuus]KAJ0944220.1 hypothetical protein HanPSC8_Chr03g0113781 [Helianthus annuus]